MGRLTSDPSLRRTTSGTPVASFTLAVDRDFKGKNTGERSTDFIDVVAWRTTSEFVSQYFTKGRMAVVEGRLEVREYTDKDGKKRRKAEIIADSVYFGDSKRDDSAGQHQNNGYNQPQSYGKSYNQGGYSHGFAAPNGEYVELADDDGELPF